MGRHKRNKSEPCCYHLTHRCHGRNYLLHFKQDRKNYLWRLREAGLRFAISVLDYMITSNHIHLLIHAPCAAELSRAMHYLQGNTARDYNRRMKLEGAFWRGRYHPTMIENGEHLAKCLFYIDLNMVRAKVCSHPSEWDGGAYHELVGNRKRYRIIDRECLLKCLGHSEDYSGFSKWYKLNLKNHLEQYCPGRELIWTESLAVGSKDWLEKLGLGIPAMKITPLANQGLIMREKTETYTLSGPLSAKEAFWKKQQEKR